MSTAPPSLPTERKFAVLLFADLSGYTRLCEQLDPEQVVAALHPVMASLRLAAEQLGGTICSTAGDGFFVSFGVPTALEDPAYRASACAREMRALIDAANTGQQPVRIPPVHIGIAAGEVLVVPTQEQVGFSLVGTAVNLASRLCDAAPPDTVFVDEQVHGLLRDRATWAPPVVLEVRGLDQHVRAWPLEQLTDAAETDQAPPFVGRGDNLQALDGHLAAVRDEQRSRVVVVGGPAGIGKTRLVTEWVTRQTDTTVVTMRCGGHARGSLDDLLRLLAPNEDGAEPARGPAVAQSELTLTADRPDPYPAMLARGRRLLSAFMSSAPMALLVDDIHEADPSLMAFLDDVRRYPVDAPVLCLVTTRTGDDLEHPFDPHPDVDITLGGLSVADVTALVSAAWPQLHREELIASLVERVAGHPLMTVHVLSYLDENDNVDLTDLPSSLRLFVASRLDRLPASEKGLLQRLSTLGSRFDAADVEAVMDAAHEADLQRLIRRRLLRHDDADGLQFDHGVVHEVAYMSLPRNVRGDLHHRHLQRLPDGEPTVRVFHALRWAEAAAIAAAPERELAAATAMREAHALALDLFRTQARSTHTLLTRVTPIAYDSAVAAPDVAVQLLSLDARCLLEMWDFERAEESAARAVDIANRFDLAIPARLDAAIVHAMTLSRMRRVHSARAVAEEVIATSERVGDEVRRGRALRVLAATWRYESLSRFTALCEESYAVGHAAGDDSAVATAQYLAYLTSTAAGNTYARWHAIASAETDDDDQWGQATLARAATMRGVYSLDFGAAEAAARRAATLGAELGAFDVVGDALLAEVTVATAYGRLDRVGELQDQLSDLSEQTGNLRLQMFAWSSAALAHLHRGDPAQAERALADARRHSEEFGPGARAEIAYVSGLVHADRGCFRAALAALEQARADTTDGPVAIEALLHRVREALISVAAGVAISRDALQRLAEECSGAGAPALASFAAAVVDLYDAQTGRGPRPRSALPAACPEERAIRADAAALWAQRDGGHAAEAWAASARLWGELGQSVWLARAQARAGDPDAAQHTLDAIGAGDEGRNWALQR